MKTLPFAFAFTLAATAALAQTTMAPGNTGTNSSTGMTGPQASPSPANPMKPGMQPGAAASSPGMGMPSRNGASAASGDNNQAVATTDSNAMQPAHGANSFSRGEARRRIESHGFQNVSDLRKSNHGVWMGKGMKDGQPVHVWLDYKGNVGQR